MADYLGFDSFDSYSDGDLNGNNGGSGFSAGWSGSTAFDVQGVTVRPGGSTKSVEVSAANWNSEVTIDRTLSSAADSGDLFISFYKSVTSGLMFPVQLRNGGTLGAYVIFENAGNLVLIGTTSRTVLTSPSGATWYDLNINWTSSTTVRARVKESTNPTWGSFTDSVTLSGSLSEITFIRLATGAAGTAPSGYWDELQGTAAAAAEGRPNNLLTLGVS